MIYLSENSGIRCIKFSLIFFSVILVVTGISLIIIGSTINEIFMEFSKFLASIYFSPAALLTSVGFVIFGVACLGCIGALKESVCTIVTFGILLGLISFLQVCAALANNMLMVHVDKEIAYNLNNSIHNYISTTDQEAKSVIDNLQQELHCCGFNGPNDWKVVYERSPPESCCAYYTEGSCDGSFHMGCHRILTAIIEESSKILSASAYLLAFTEILGMGFAFYLGKMLSEQKRAREYRRWAIRNQLLNNITFDNFTPEQNLFYGDITKKVPVYQNCDVK